MGRVHTLILPVELGEEARGNLPSVSLMTDLEIVLKAQSHSLEGRMVVNQLLQLQACLNVACVSHGAFRPAD